MEKRKMLRRFLPYVILPALSLSCKDVLRPLNSTGPLEGSWYGETETIVATPFSYSVVLGDTEGFVSGTGKMEINHGNPYCDVRVIGQREEENFSIAIGCFGYISASYVGKISQDGKTTTGTLTLPCHNTSGSVSNTCSAIFTMQKKDSTSAVKEDSTALEDIVDDE